MSSYRFCRSDDIPLLVRAYNSCYRPHDPALPEMTVEVFKRSVRELSWWSSSCMVASGDAGPVAVLLAAKRPTETLIHRVGVHPDHLHQGHGRHLLTSLSAKLAILGPPRMVAEVPEEMQQARAFLEAFGYREETQYTDFVRPGSPDTAAASELVVPTTVDELLANEAIDLEARVCWERAPATLVQRKNALAGLAVVSDRRVESFVLFEAETSSAECRVLSLGCADEDRRRIWFDLLLAHHAASDPRPMRIRRVGRTELPFELLESLGFVPGGRTHGYLASPVAA